MKRILSFNVLGAPKDQDRTRFPLRLDSILQEISQMNLDVICLQEVPQTYIHLVREWAQTNNWYCSPENQDEIQCITLCHSSSTPSHTETLALPNPISALNYHAVATQLDWALIINCHLHHGVENQATREKQLQFIHESFLSRHPTDVLLCGDFNIDFLKEGLPHKITDQWMNYQDTVQPFLKQKPTQSSLLNKLIGKEKNKRPDGFFAINAKHLQAKDCQLAFDAPSSLLKTHLSDHFGLTVSLVKV